MSLGKEITKIKEKRLEMLGYKKIPFHCESKVKADEQWVQGIDIFGNAHFPRYHILKVGKKMYLHCDWDKEHENVWDTGDIIKHELWRIKYLFV